MTRLTLLRHAKSSWDSPELPDLHRPLNSRGQRDAPLMGLVCAERLPPPDLVLLSPSVRTRETIERFLEAWNAAAPRTVVVEQLYLASYGDWNDTLTTYGNNADHLLACGHQPGIGDLAARICTGFRGGVPTAAVISFLIHGKSLEADNATLDFFARPRDFK